MLQFKQTTQSVNSLLFLFKTVFMEFLKIIGVQNKSPIMFGYTAMIRIKIIIVRNDTPAFKHEFAIFNILLHIKGEPKVIQK